jgi:hypothetical protein
MEGNELDKIKGIWGFDGPAAWLTVQPQADMSDLSTQTSKCIVTPLIVSVHSVNFAPHANTPRPTVHCTHLVGVTTADATSGSQTGSVSVKQLVKHAQAGQFLMHFAEWQQKLQKRLHVATTVDGTLAALHVWTAFYFYNQPRVDIVTYVAKRLKRLLRANEQRSDVDVLSKWSTALHNDAQKAAGKLQKVCIPALIRDLVLHVSSTACRHVA